LINNKSPFAASSWSHTILFCLIWMCTIWQSNEGRR